MEMKTIIDGHMHILQWQRSDGKSVFEALEDYCNDNGISFVDNMCCSNNADLWDGYEMDQSILGAIVKLRNPNVFTHGCLYIPKDPAMRGKFRFRDQLEELMELGLDGIKICDFKPDAYNILGVADNLDEYDDFIGCCEKNHVHMCWHVADPSYFWDASKVTDAIKKRGWFYGDGNYVSYEYLISMAYRLIEAHPALHVMLAHAFFKSNDPDEVVALLENHPNVTIDLAPGGEMFNGYRENYAKWYGIFRKFSDRFVYATDVAATSSDEYRSRIAGNVLRFLETDDEFDYSDTVRAHGIKLESGPLENILHKNHEREVGIRPREIDKRALKRYIERYLPLMPDSNNKRMTEEFYRKELL